MALLKKKNKLPTQDLTKEVGVAGTVIFEGMENEEARADNVSIKKYREMMDRDPTVESLYNIFTLPIIAATYRIDADKDDASEQQADDIRRNLLEPSYKGGMETPMSLFLDQLLLSIVDGFQLWEKVYRLDGQRYVLRKLAHRDSIGITLIRDKEGGYGGARQIVSFGGEAVDVKLAAHKTFLFTHNKARDFLYGRSAFRSLRKAYEKKAKLEYLDSIALQADAIKPKVLVRTQDGITNDANGKPTGIVKTTLAALAKLGERNAVASIPFGYDIKEITQKGRDPHQSIERQNSEMARAFLATFTLLGSQGGSNVGSYALSDNLSDMLMISLTAFMKKAEEHINQYLIAELHDLNYATPHYSEFHFDDLTSDTIKVITEAFQKLLEKDRISDEMVEGIEEATANRLEIDLEQIKKDRKKRTEKEAKETASKAAAEAEKPKDDNTPDDNAGGGNQLSDISSRDFPGLHEGLGINTDDLGCIMLDLQTFDVLKHVEGGTADLDPDKGVVAESEAHVTLLYGLLQNGNTIKEQVDKVLDGWSLDSVVLDEITSFAVPAGATAVPIVARLWDGRLSEAHDRLSLLPHVNTFTDYNPHVTIAYVKNDPDIVQKWVKALRTELAGMRLNATGINYGDAPAGDDKEDDANSGGKFLSDDTRWSRPLTEAEKTVRFADINTKMDTFEEKFLATMEPITAEVIDSIVKGTKGADPTKFDVMLPPDYDNAIFGTIKEAYNYAKIGAADELKVSAPATSKEALQGMRDYTAFITEKQQDDLKNLVRGELLKAKRQGIELADGDNESMSAWQKFQAALGLTLGAWFLSKLKSTSGAIVSQGINNGRNDVFDEVANEDDLFQFSGLLDTKICRICRDLDGKVVDREEYRRTRWVPPIHFHCRCLWILIRKVSEEFQLPDITGLPEVAGGATGPSI